jgi:hypothetical protein
MLRMSNAAGLQNARTLSSDIRLAFLPVFYPIEPLYATTIIFNRPEVNVSGRVACALWTDE